MKDGDYKEVGEIKTKGQRTDLVLMAKDMAEMTHTEMLEKHGDKYINAKRKLIDTVKDTKSDMAKKKMKLDYEGRGIEELAVRDYQIVGGAD